MFGSSSTTADNKLGSGSSFGSNNNPLFGGKKDDNKSSAFTLGSKPENNEGPKAPLLQLTMTQVNRLLVDSCLGLKG